MRLLTIFAPVTIAIISISTSCSSFDLIPSDSLIQRLKGRGPVLVSVDNPFLAANLLLKQESETSKELSGFLENKGFPSALSVSQDFLSPVSLKLFYQLNIGLQRTAEEYDLELLQGVWVINGPFEIKDQEAKQLLETSTLNTSNRVPSKSRNKSGNDSRSIKQQKIPAQEYSPLFEEKPNKKIIQTEKSENKQSNIEQIIKKYPSSPAETTPRGDVVHFVTSDKETLEIICEWYTKSGLTLARIARANKLAPSATLGPGDQVVIPAELAKNKMRLTEKAITALAQ